MNEPTEWQVKELWEWCGLNSKHEFVPIGFDGMKECKKCGEMYPNPVRSHCPYPEIDLNNLFKYAVPLLDRGEVQVYPGKVSYAIAQKGDKYCVHSHKDPALALFWAAREVLHE